MEPWFVLWNLLLLRLLYISIKVLYGDAWNTVVMFRLVLLAAIWNWIQKWICRPAGPSLAACFEPLAHPRNFASLVFSISTTFEDVHLNWLNWFHFLIFEGGLLFILIDCMMFLSPFLDVTRMSMSTVSFLAQLDSGILCL